MPNDVKKNIEIILNSDIKQYISMDPYRICVTEPNISDQFFSEVELERLEKLLSNIDNTLLNLIFLTNEDEIMLLDPATIQFNEKILVEKYQDKYIFYDIGDEDSNIFEIISQDHYQYSEFDAELSRLLSPKTLKKLYKK